MLATFKKINQSVWIEWLFRFCFTIEFIHTAIVLPTEHYPDVCWLLLLISVWLYFFEFKIIGLVPIVLVAIIHYFH